MTEKKILQLHAEEVWWALEEFDPVAVLAEDLIGRNVGYAGDEKGQVTPWPSRGADSDTDLVLINHPDDDVSYVAPVEALLLFQAAALVAIAARELVEPGGITVAMLGMNAATQPQLAVIARYVPSISHVAVCVPGSDGASLPAPWLADQLELSGIDFSVTSTPAEAAFGANLVVAANDSVADLARLHLGDLARGTVMVNATGHDLSDALLEGVDEVYVDDLASLDDDMDRRVAALPRLPRRIGDPVDGPAVVADLGQLLTHAYLGRGRQDDVLLVELLTVRAVNIRLAREICAAARKCGRGAELVP